jgi:AAA15 family ATPase/GTPase
MDSIRIKNLRCLVDTGEIPIKPLTILVGANSTGKSTFLRVFPLLRQSVEAKTSSPILWYAGHNGYVDFGTIKGAIRASEKSVSFGYKFEPTGILSSRFNTHLGFIKKILKDLTIEIELISNKENESQTKISTLIIDFNERHAVLGFDHFGKVIRFDINERSFMNKLGALEIKPTNLFRFIPIIFDQTDNFRENYINNLVKLIALMYHKDTSPHSICNMLREILGKPEDFTNELKKIKNTPQVWQKNIAHLTDEEIKLIYDVSFACVIPFLLSFANEEIYQFAKTVQYIAPSRAVAERFYRTREISVEEIDHHGENLPMYIHSAT